MDCEESLFSSFIASFMQFCPLERKMVKLTMIARIVDGLPLAEGLDDGRDIPDADFYKQQVKSLFKNLATGHNEPSRMSIETGPYMFQCHLLRELKGHFATATFLFSVEMADYCRVLSTQVFI
nr:25.3 kDa vesicle transport protein [Ipomoea batatas]